MKLIFYSSYIYWQIRSGNTTFACKKELNQYVEMSVDYERNACKKELNQYVKWVLTIKGMHVKRNNQYVKMSVDYERNACKKN